VMLLVMNEKNPKIDCGKYPKNWLSYFQLAFYMECEVYLNKAIKVFKCNEHL
jgi:hypothetical protein